MSSEPLSERVLQYGLTEVVPCPDARVDIVLVHGLNGHPYNSWATHKPEVFWPADLLPDAVQDQKCRILTYGYDANVTAFTDGVSKDKIHNHAEHLASRLVANRALKRALERPIIFVCHSLGGLVVKRCLIYSESLKHTHTERLRSIYVSTYGILFLGTPHNGSDIAKWGTMLERISSAVLPKKFFDSSPQLVQALKSNNETLQNINRLFVEIIPRFHIYFFHESKPMDLKGTREFVVDEDSAAPVLQGVERMGIEQDHSHMCKFESENAPGYDVVAEAIQRYADEAPTLIQPRWDEEKKIREFEKRGVAREILGDTALLPGSNTTPTAVTPTPQTISNVSSTTSMKLLEAKASEEEDVPPQDGPPIVAPLHFRPNLLFLGFESEIDELYRKLHSRRPQELGSNAVLVTGPIGSGKTYLTRQYFFQYRNDYPSGTFWIDCRSRESIATAFWEIGISIKAVDETQDPNLTRRQSQDFVDSVRRKLESMSDWLLVFDAIEFDSEDDLDDFRRYVPDKVGNNIIYTSVDTTLRNRQKLLQPTQVRVQPLGEEDACVLLYHSLGIRRPNSRQKAKARELVNDYQCLPLAIHAAAHALIEKGKSLERYTHSTPDTRLAGPFEEILSALHEKLHVEALNLITLLSFFSQTIPVALINFGARGLEDFQVDILSPRRIYGARKDLDSTIAILLRSGLVERTLQSYPLAMSGSASPEDSRSTKQVTDGRSIEPPLRQNSTGLTRIVSEDSSPEQSFGSSSSTIDVLRVHPVVQNVIREELKERGLGDLQEYWWWLTAAVRLLSYSFVVAHERMKKSSGQGLRRDYREYDEQAIRLWSFFPKSSRNAGNELRTSRHELHELIRAIRREILAQSPSQSSDSSGRMFQLSVFEYTSSSEGENRSSISDLTRESTWSLHLERPPSESPTALSVEEDNPLDWHRDDDDAAIETDSDDDDLWPAKSDTTETPDDYLEDRSRRSSIIRAIFKGRPTRSQKHKDLGEWKPMPVPPSISQPDVLINHARSVSQSRIGDSRIRRPSAGSEAEASLTAVHRFSPPASRGGRIRSPSRGVQSDQRQPLANRSTNAQLSPLASAFQPGEVVDPYKPEPPPPRLDTRRPSSSPRLMQALLTSRAESSSTSRPPLTPLSIDYIDSLPSRTRSQQFPQAQNRPLPSISQLDSGASGLPTGYSSVPMSRDTSRESDPRTSPTSTSAIPTISTTLAHQRALSDSYIQGQSQTVQPHSRGGTQQHGANDWIYAEAEAHRTQPVRDGSAEERT